MDKVSVEDTNQLPGLRTMQCGETMTDQARD